MPPTSDPSIACLNHHAPRPLQPPTSQTSTVLSTPSISIQQDETKLIAFPPLLVIHPSNNTMASVPVPRQHHMFQIILCLAVAAVGVQAQLTAASAPPLRASPSYRCDWCPSRSTASLLPPDAAAITGAACGYGASDTAEIVAAGGGFHIAAVSPGLFRRGRACGACYQLRCRDRAACAEDGVKVVVVADDAVDTNRTGGGAGRFLLTNGAFAAMTNRGAMPARRDDAPVDVDFRRIPCAYGFKNLSVKVEEASVRSRGRLALRFLHQGGQTDIVAVEVAQAVVDGASDSSESSQTTWRYMTRSEGSPGLWRTSRAPAGPLQIRFVVTSGSGGKWLRSDGAVLPADWVPGGVYDTGLRVADVAASTCGGASCGNHDEDSDLEFR